MQSDKCIAKEVPWNMTYKVLSCGSNGNFQLGVGDQDDHNTLQEAMFEPVVTSKPVKFAFGGNHTLILFENGQVYASGSNEYGQCAVENPKMLTSFTLVPGVWRNIAAGWEYSLLVSRDNRLLSCGRGLKGELGLGKEITTSGLREISLLGTILEIQSSINHVIVKCEDAFYGWGNCRKGQMGPVELNEKGKPLGSYWKPTKLPILAAYYCMGHDRTVLLSKTGTEVIGKNPEKLNGNSTNKIRAMWSSVHIGDEGGILSYGNNLHGQLFTYEAPSEIVDFEVGSEHGAVLLLNNQVYAWGWGEHGNCGVQGTDSVTFPINKIYEGTAKVKLLACGNATTWLVVE